jgi:hypothetical protein
MLKLREFPQQPATQLPDLSSETEAASAGELERRQGKISTTFDQLFALFVFW